MSNTPTEEQFAAAVAALKSTLGADGWRVKQTRTGARASRGLLAVTLKLREGRHEAGPWRARFHDGFIARFTVAENWGAGLTETLRPVLANAREVGGFVSQGGGLIRNPSKSWVAHRLWGAVRPEGFTKAW